MAKETKAQKETVERVMHEYKEGTLESGQGSKVRNPKQAIAIALSEAGASNRQTPAESKRRLSDTKRKEKAGVTAPGTRKKTAARTKASASSSD